MIDVKIIDLALRQGEQNSLSELFAVWLMYATDFIYDIKELI